MNTGVKQTKKVSTKQSAKERRKRVIERLQEQLTTKVKIVASEDVGHYKLVPLEERDIERINSEITILKQRI